MNMNMNMNMNLYRILDKINIKHKKAHKYEKQRNTNITDRKFQLVYVHNDVAH